MPKQSIQSKERRIKIAKIILGLIVIVAAGGLSNYIQFVR
jgi:hypothetical protein